MESPLAPPAFGEALRFWIKLGWISFGGPAGQIAVMHHELVERRRWIGEESFLHALNFCMLLPGPEAQQLAIYLGWRMHGARGGIAAGIFFVLPSIFILWGLAWIYAIGGQTGYLAGIFHGLMGAVIAIVLSAGIRIAKKSLATPLLALIATLAFIAIFFFKISFVAVLCAAAFVGFFGAGACPSQFLPAQRNPDSTIAKYDTIPLSSSCSGTWLRAGKIFAICFFLWAAPVAAAGFFLGVDSVPFRSGLFFSKVALVTFGGAYAVLPYVSQMAVDHHGWLTQSEMMAGLGLAETTPGPLIMVLQFVGFLSAWHQPGNLPPALAGTIGALVTTWVTFVPCFLFVFLGAPHVENLRKNLRLTAALGAITAAVVGVILNLAVWFTWHAARPREGVLDWFVIATAIGTFLLLQRLKTGVIPVLLASAAAGLLWHAWSAQ